MKVISELQGFLTYDSQVSESLVLSGKYVTSSHLRLSIQCEECSSVSKQWLVHMLVHI